MSKDCEIVEFGGGLKLSQLQTFGKMDRGPKLGFGNVDKAGVDKAGGHLTDWGGRSNGASGGGNLRLSGASAARLEN